MRQILFPRVFFFFEVFKKYLERTYSDFGVLFFVNIRKLILNRLKIILPKIDLNIIYY